MSPGDRFSRHGYWIGPFAAAYAWVVILACAQLNPWWSVTSRALSYMGASTATDPWLYNYVGMVPTGAMIAIFSVFLFRIARNRTERFGSAHFLLAGVLLMGIGIWHQGPGPYPPGTSPQLGQDLHDLFSAWFFLQALLAVVTWGVGLRREDRRPLGLGMVVLAFGAWTVGVVLALALGRPHGGTLQLAGEGGIALGVPVLAVGAVLALRPSGHASWERWGTYLAMIGALLAGIGVLAGFGNVPGGVGEVLGILATDVWVGLMFFAREGRPFPFARRPAGRDLRPGEDVVLPTRGSLLHAFQVPALALVLTGMFLFFYGNYYLTQQLVGLLLGSVRVSSIVGPTLALYLSGFLLVVLGTWRWSRVVPPGLGSGLLVLVVTVPLVTIAAWFGGTGDLALLSFFLLFGALVPLALALLQWRSTRYVLTERRALAVTHGPFPALSSLPRGEIVGLAHRRGPFHRWFGVGDILFVGHAGEGGRRQGRVPPERVAWTGVAGSSATFEEVQRELRLPVVRAPRPRHRPMRALLAAGVVVPLVLALTLVPVFEVTTTVEMPCAFLLGNLHQIESDPWPYIHNVSLPTGHIAFRWWSGTEVWMIVGQLPVGLAYENAPLASNSSSLPTDLTSSGSGGYTSYGGSSFAACIALSAGTTVTLQLTYAAPLLWA